MQIRPSNDPAGLPGSMQRLGRTERGPAESPQNPGQRIVLEHTPAESAHRVHDVFTRKAPVKIAEHDHELPKEPAEIRPENKQVRKQLASLDRAMRKRLFHMGKEHGLDRSEMKTLAQEFHKSVREAYQSYRSGDIANRDALVLEVRGAFEVMRDGFQAALAASREGPKMEGPMVASAGQASGSGTVTSQTSVATSTPTDPNASTSSSTISGVVTKQTRVATTAAPAPSSSSGSSSSSGVVTAQTPAPAGMPPEPEFDSATMPTVDELSHGAVPEHDHHSVMSEALGQLIERYEASVKQLEELFAERSARRPGMNHGIYNAAGAQGLERLSGEGFDATA